MNINVNTWIIVNNQIRGHGVIIAFTWCTVISGFFVYSKKKSVMSLQILSIGWDTRHLILNGQRILTNLCLILSVPLPSLIKYKPITSRGSAYLLMPDFVTKSDRVLDFRLFVNEKKCYTFL